MMATFVASTLTRLRHPDGRMVDVEPGEAVDDGDPIAVEYPHLFTVDEAPAKKAQRARKR